MLAAARETFVDQGYHAASLDLIARRAGYSKGAVYSNFASKESLFLETMEREVRRLLEGRVSLTATATTPEEYVDLLAAWILGVAADGRAQWAFGRVRGARRPRPRDGPAAARGAPAAHRLDLPVAGAGPPSTSTSGWPPTRATPPCSC